MTRREGTERSVVVAHGTNHVLGQDLGAVLGIIEEIVPAHRPERTDLALRDGRSAERVVGILEEHHG
ncbi:MAG: hypothetical protein M3N43_02760 [Actinomycetota bacterium]|nr:hypothetical protein [Actinomycetota bacterium]